jgi:mono/diheme cytochrome c family protein
MSLVGRSIVSGVLAIALLAAHPGTGAAAQPAANATQAAPAASSNSGTRITNATRGGIQDRSSKSPAEALFVEKCAMCHRQMGMGTVILARRMDPSVAMLEARRDLSPEFVIQAARSGIGNMPRISRGEVSDEQLAIIARYLAKGNK